MESLAVSATECGLQVDVRPGANCAVVSVRGDLDRGSAAALERSVLPLIGASGSLGIVLDLSGIGALDRHGLNVLMHLFQKQRELGGWLRLVVFGDRVRRLLSDTGLDGVLPTFASVRDAVSASLASAGARAGVAATPTDDVVDLRHRRRRAVTLA